MQHSQNSQSLRENSAPNSNLTAAKAQISTQNSSADQATKAAIISIIDSLKATCASYGLGNDGNEYKIIITAFLYKFLNDKFAYEAKRAEPKLAAADKEWEREVAKFSDDEFEMLKIAIGTNCAKLNREHFLAHLASRQNSANFAALFDKTLIDIATLNRDLFAIKVGNGQKVELFEGIAAYITDTSKRDNFARAVIGALEKFNFEAIFSQKFDFFMEIFEYLISDYNKDGGGKYAEYFTPRAVARIIASVLVGDERPKSVKCYDPSAGSGSLLMNLAHAIGEQNCTIYSQDISQKSSTMLRLNLILNSLIHSISNIIQANTLTEPSHEGKKFDFIVSNPPFKLDFSDFSATLAAAPNSNLRFFAGIPKVPNKDKDKMAIYLCFLQHIIYSLAPNGKAAVVVPTGFLTAQSSIERTIRERLIATKSLRGVISMPSNIFATTGTNVSVLFIDNAATQRKALLMDASKLGTKIKEGKNQKTILRQTRKRA